MKKIKVQWYVYILLCSGKRFYTGMTNNLAERFKKHKSGKGGHFTRAFKPVKILFSQKLATKSLALKREAEIKRWTKSEKTALILKQGKRNKE